MSDLRFVRANQHAIPLLEDILENALRCLPEETAALFHDDFAAVLNSQSGEGRHYEIGFQEHVPVGYVRYDIGEAILEVSSPWLYPDYLHEDIAEAMVMHCIEVAKLSAAVVVYGLIPVALDVVLQALQSNDFEIISAEPEFIRRWRDGLLADRSLPTGVCLVANLIEIE